MECHGFRRVSNVNFSREIFALQLHLLQMRLVITSFRFHSSGTSRAADQFRWKVAFLVANNLPREPG